MYSRLFVPVCLVAMIVLTACGSAYNITNVPTAVVFTESAVKEFKSEAGGFSVMTAAELQEQVFPAVTMGVSRPEIHSFSGKLTDLSYGVSYYTLSEYYASSGADPSSASPESLLGIADSYFFIDGLPGSPTTLGADGYYSRELSFEHQESKYKARLILSANSDHPAGDDNRVYAVFVSAPIGLFDETAADDFLNSFKLLR